MKRLRLNFMSRLGRFCRSSIVVLIVALNASEAAPELYEYQSIFSRMGLYAVLEGGEGRIGVGGPSASLRACPPASGYICFLSDMLEFAIPRSGVKVGSEWQYANQSYKVFDKRKYTDRGRVLDNSVWLIEGKKLQEGSERHYAFSYRCGLLAIQIIGADYLLHANGRGLGASVACKPGTFIHGHPLPNLYDVENLHNVE